MNKDIFETAPSRKMSREEMVSVITDVAAPAAASFGMEIWGIEMAGAGKPVVRIYVDAPVASAADADSDDKLDVQGGVGIDQCAEISRMVGIALDVEGIFDGAWTLEISSPGMDRPFFRAAQLPPYIGQEIDVTLWDAHPDFDLRKRFCGTLVKAEEGAFTLHMTGLTPPNCEADVNIKWDSVRRARLVPVFPDTSKPGKSAAPGSRKDGAAKKSAGGGKKA